MYLTVLSSFSSTRKEEELMYLAGFKFLFFLLTYRKTCTVVTYPVKLALGSFNLLTDIHFQLSVTVINFSLSPRNKTYRDLL